MLPPVVLELPPCSISYTFKDDLFLFPCLLLCNMFFHVRRCLPLQTEYHVGFIHLLLSVSLPLTVFKLQDAVLCRCATETMHEIYWPQVLPFDTQDVANRSCAISHLLQPPCKADLSCLQAIFKLWAPETYGAMGNFIINALHLSDLIQACRRLCRSMPYIYTLLWQRRANQSIDTIAGGASLWTAPRSRHEIIGCIYSAPLEKKCEEWRKRGWWYYSKKQRVDQRVKHEGTWHFEESPVVKCQRFQLQKHSSAFTFSRH